MQIKPLVTFSLIISAIVFCAVIIGGYLAVKYPTNIQPVQNLSATPSPTVASVKTSTTKKTSSPVLTVTPTPTTPKPTSPASSGVTMADVAKHNSANDCWLAISGKAYNVTSYAGSHPGGRGVITNSCGTEVSGIFASIHSNFAWNLLGQYYVAPIN